MELALLVFGLALVHYALSSFEMVIYILCHCMMEVCDVPFDFDLIGD